MRSKGLFIPSETKYPLMGLDSSSPSTALDPRFSPSCKNVFFEQGVVKKRLGYVGFGAGDLLSTVTEHPIIGLVQHEDTDGDLHLLAITTREFYRYDSGSDEWVCISDVLTLSKCEGKTGWTDPGDNITLHDEDEETIVKLGDMNFKIAVWADFETGALAYVNEHAAPLDLTDAVAISFWFRSSIALGVGNVQYVITESETFEKAPEEGFAVFDIPACDANTWYYLTLTPNAEGESTFANLNAVENHGFWGAVDKGECFLYVYNISAKSSRWTGDKDDAFTSARLWSGANLDVTETFMSNGKDIPVLWNSSDAYVTEFKVLDVDVDYVKCVATFMEMAIAANFSVDSVYNSHGFAWSDIGDITNWTTGDSGDADLTDLDGEIVRLEPLGDRLVIYSTNSIMTCAYTGSEAVFAFDLRIHDSHLISGKSVVNLGPYHIFASTNNFFLFDGTRGIREIGRPIEKEYISDLDPTYASRSFAYHDVPRRRVYFFYPHLGSGGKITKAFVLDYDLTSVSNWVWSKYSMSKDILCMAGFQGYSALLSWDNLAEGEGTPWETWDGPWLHPSEKEGFLTLIIGSTEGDVFLHDETERNDDGGVIESFFETKDFTVPQSYKSSYGRWMECEMELKGDSVEVFYSTDGGAGFVNIMSSDDILKDKWRYIKYQFDVHAKQLRIKVQNNSTTGGFELRNIRVWLREGAPR